MCVCVSLSLLFWQKGTNSSELLSCSIRFYRSVALSFSLCLFKTYNCHGNFEQICSLVTFCCGVNVHVCNSHWIRVRTHDFGRHSISMMMMVIRTNYSHYCYHLFLIRLIDWACVPSKLTNSNICLITDRTCALSPFHRDLDSWIELITNKIDAINFHRPRANGVKWTRKYQYFQAHWLYHHNRHRSHRSIA